MAKEYFLDHDIYSDEYITGFRLAEICLNTKRARFCKAELLDKLKIRCNVLVTHNGDKPIDKKTFFKHYKKVDIKWFTQNKDYNCNTLEGIPIGLDNTFLWHDILCEFSQQKIKHNEFILLNFRDETERPPSKCREKIRNWYSNMPWVTNMPYAKSKYLPYYKTLAEHKMVFSPQGNGFDCVRTWEALYLRTVPVVLRSTAMNEFQDLPILFVDKWDGITKDFLEEQYDRIINTKYDLSKMRLGWWKKRIECYAKIFR